MSLVLQTIYQIWCPDCGGQVYRSMDAEAAQTALEDHADMHSKAAECDHPLEIRMYGVGEQPTQTCGKCGFNLPVTWDREGSESMLAPTQAEEA